MAARHERPVVARLARPLGSFEQHRQAVGITPVMQCGTDAHREVERRDGISWLEEPRRLDPASIVGDRLLVCVGVLGTLTSGTDELDRLTRVPKWQREAGVPGPLRLDTVVGQRRGQRGGGPGVKLEPAAQRQFVIPVRPEQGVNKCEPGHPRRMRHHEARGLG